MVDVELIKANYSRMADSQLIELTKTEGTIISYEAFVVLKKEFIKRNLDRQVLREVETRRIEKAKDDILTNMEKEETAINNKLWEFIIQQKFEGKADKEIIQALIDKGLSIEDSTNIINNLETLIAEASKRTSNKLFTGIMSIFIASFIAYLSYRYWDNWLWVFLPMIFIIRLLGPFLQYFEQNDKYNFILKNIRKE